MAAGPKALSSRELDEYVEATERARAVRADVAQQVADGIVEADITGGEGLLVARLTELSRARRTGDRDLVRSAVFELTVAGGSWLAAIDLGQRQATAPPQRRRAAA